MSSYFNLTMSMDYFQDDNAGREIIPLLQVLLRKSNDQKFVSLVTTHIDLCVELLYGKWHLKLLYTGV